MMIFCISKEKVNLKDIIIEEEFFHKKPGAQKLARYYHQYKTYGTMNNDIVVDGNYVLKDGYISYLIYKMFDVETVYVYVDCT